MFHPNEETFERLWLAADAGCSATTAYAGEQKCRVALWKKQEFHNWLRWHICRSGFDWSKPGVLLLNALGFAALVAYGFKSGNFYVTAGGIVAWFTLVNLAFFTYFGLTLPGPPAALPLLNVAPSTKIRAHMGLYPPGYERRKLARIRLTFNGANGASVNMELAVKALPQDLQALLKAQTPWRMQRGDAPRTLAVFQAADVTRDALDAGESPGEIIAWSWDENALQAFLKLN